MRNRLSSLTLESTRQRQISARRRTHRAGRPCRPDKNGAARAACNHPLLRMADRSWPQRTPYRMPPPMAEIHRNRKTSRISFPTMRAKPLFDDNSRISRAPKTRLQDSQSADFGEFSPPQRLLRFRQPPLIPTRSLRRMRNASETMRIDGQHNRMEAKRKEPGGSLLHIVQLKATRRRLPCSCGSRRSPPSRPGPSWRTRSRTSRTCPWRPPASYAESRRTRHRSSRPAARR